MPILHQFKLMTSNGFGILLILIERLKRDMSQTCEGLQGNTGGIWKQRMSRYDNQEKRTLERTTVRIENERRKDKETPGRIRERMKILEGI